MQYNEVSDIIAPAQFNDVAQHKAASVYPLALWNKQTKFLCKLLQPGGRVPRCRHHNFGILNSYGEHQTEDNTKPTSTRSQPGRHMPLSCIDHVIGILWATTDNCL